MLARSIAYRFTFRHINQYELKIANMSQINFRYIARNSNIMPFENVTGEHCLSSSRVDPCSSIETSDINPFYVANVVIRVCFMYHLLAYTSTNSAIYSTGFK